jgi:hypothetical protein
MLERIVCLTLSVAQACADRATLPVYYQPVHFVVSLIFFESLFEESS